MNCDQLPVIFCNLNFNYLQSLFSHQIFLSLTRPTSSRVLLKLYPLLSSSELWLDLPATLVGCILQIIKKLMAGATPSQPDRRVHSPERVRASSFLSQYSRAKARPGTRAYILIVLQSFILGKILILGIPCYHVQVILLDFRPVRYLPLSSVQVSVIFSIKSFKRLSLKQFGYRNPLPLLEPITCYIIKAYVLSNRSRAFLGQENIPLTKQVTFPVGCPAKKVNSDLSRSPRIHNQRLTMPYTGPGKK